MSGRYSAEHKFLSLLRAKPSKQRKIVVGLKSDAHSREMLLSFLHTSANPGDNVLAVHVQEACSSFDPNSFHVHADLCQSRKVDFLVKVCAGESYVSGLSDQVRLNSATILVLGCSLRWPKGTVVKSLLKSLPPTCNLLVMNNAGKIIFQSQGTSQQGFPSPVLRPSQSEKKYVYRPKVGFPQLQKSLTASSSSKDAEVDKKTFELSDCLVKEKFDRLMHILATRPIRHFTWEELNSATNNFVPELLIGKGGGSKVYSGALGDGQAIAVKVLKSADLEDLLREVQILSGLSHKNIVKIIGCCDGKEMHAVVYTLLKGSLKRKLEHLNWKERMGVAIGVAKALEYLHHSFTPPIVHRDVKASNILLSENLQPQLSDFGAAIRLEKLDQISANVKPFDVVGTFGYLAPEYVMYGRVDVKIDVYSYGVVLLELITGKEAIQTNQANCESLVLWARSLLSSSLCDRLIDPRLNGDYNKDEIETLVFLARLCLIHSSSRRPSMKMILRLFEDPEYRRQMLSERDEFADDSSSDQLDDQLAIGMPT